MNEEQSANQNKQTIQLKIDPAQEAGQYANAVSITITPRDVVLDFGYNIPNQNPVTIKLVGRINLTHQTAEDLMNILSNGMLDWRNKQKGNN